MFITIIKDSHGFFLFIRGFERRARVSQGRVTRPLQPKIKVGEAIFDATAEEIGQILGGN